MTLRLPNPTYSLECLDSRLDDLYPTLCTQTQLTRHIWSLFSSRSLISVLLRLLGLDATFGDAPMTFLVGDPDRDGSITGFVPWPVDRLFHTVERGQASSEGFAKKPRFRALSRGLHRP